jgi:hypothetical protein
LFVFFFFFFFFCCTGVWTWGFMLSLQVLYHLSHTSNFECFNHTGKINA